MMLIHHCPEKVLDIQDAGKPSEKDHAGLHIDNQVGKQGYKILTLTTSPVCQKNSNSGLFDRVHEGNSKDALTSSGIHKKSHMTTTSAIYRENYNQCARYFHSLLLGSSFYLHSFPLYVFAYWLIPYTSYISFKI